MAYTPSDFDADKSGPQFAWLDVRLTLHGFPALHLFDTLQKRLQRWQLAQGWKGTEKGGDADGYMGRVSLARLTADPKPSTPPVLVLDFGPWKATLPIGEDEHPTELRPVREEAPWLTNHGTHWTFRAHKGGTTTSGSSNPRCELREMDPREWDARDGRHRLDVFLAVTHLHPGVPVVVGQIHDDADDVTVFRVEGTKLWITNGDNSRAKLVTDTLAVGQRFHIGFDVYDGLVHFTFNGKPVDYTVPAGDGNYFKTGCYFQAAKYDIPDTAYAEVAIYAIGVSHD